MIAHITKEKILTSASPRAIDIAVFIPVSYAAGLPDGKVSNKKIHGV